VTALVEGQKSLVTPSAAPKQVYAFASTGLLTGVVLIAGNIFLARSGQSFAMLTAVLALFVTLRAIRTLSTRVTEAGVTQLTWTGPVHLAWTEVTEVARRRLSFTLTGAKGQVVVSLEEFQDTAAAITFIESHLPSNLRTGKPTGQIPGDTLL